MNNKQKKALYESIMKSVVKTVKKTLNESYIDDNEIKFESYLQKHGELSLYGEYDLEDADGWHTMKLDTAYLDSGNMVTIGYTKEITIHELHTSDDSYETVLFIDLDNNIQKDIIEQLENAIYEDEEE